MRSQSFLLCLLLLPLCLSSCSDKVDKEDLYVFKAMTIRDLVNSREELSMFAKAMERSHNSTKSASIPTNEAIKLYLDSVYGTMEYSIDTMSEAIANRIVLNCVMDFGKEKAFRIADLYEGSLTEGTLDDHHLVIRFGNWGDGSIVKINGKARIVHADLECTNGYAHIVDRVITPAPNTLSQLIAETGNLRIFYHLLETTTWADSLLKYRDRNYVQPGEGYAKYRLYGYMAFTETDEVFHREWGVPLPVIHDETGSVTNWEEIMAAVRQKCAEAYPEATGKDPCGEDNALNRFVSYHLIPFKMSYDKLTIKENIRGHTREKLYGIAPVNTWSYFPTMGKTKRLLKITETATDGVRHINRHSFYDNSFNGDYHEWGCDIEGVTLRKDNGGWENFCVNGCYYPIDNILVYSPQVRDVVLNERIRYNITQSQPEVINSNLIDKAESFTTTFLTEDFCDNFIVNDKGNLLLSAYPGGNNDYSYSPRGITTWARDYSFKLLPVPFSGNWEVRLRYPSSGYDNIYRVYIGTNPAKPAERKYLGTHRFSQWAKTLGGIADNDLGKDSTLCLENDRTLRLHNAMNLPNIMGVVDLSSEKGWSSFRAKYATTFRWIAYRGHLSAEKEYFIRFQAITEGHCAHSPAEIELVPESVYDNPDKAEDIW